MCPHTDPNRPCIRQVELRLDWHKTSCTRPTSKFPPRLVFEALLQGTWLFFARDRLHEPTRRRAILRPPGRSGPSRAVFLTPLLSTARSSLAVALRGFSARLNTTAYTRIPRQAFRCDTLGESQISACRTPALQKFSKSSLPLIARGKVELKIGVGVSGPLRAHALWQRRGLPDHAHAVLPPESEHLAKNCQESRRATLIEVKRATWSKRLPTSTEFGGLLTAEEHRNHKAPRMKVDSGHSTYCTSPSALPSLAHDFCEAETPSVVHCRP
jgi:hypothetical protein